MNLVRYKVMMFAILKHQENLVSTSIHYRNTRKYNTLMAMTQILKKSMQQVTGRGTKWGQDNKAKKMPLKVLNQPTFQRKRS